MGSAVRGHGLIYNGAAMERAAVGLWPTQVTADDAYWLPAHPGYSTSGVGIGVCRCGASSAVLPTAAARKAWHREHKDAIRGES